MPSASFYANFEQFDAAVAGAASTLQSFELSTKNVQGQLTRLAKSFDGSTVIRTATLTATAIEKIGGAAKLTEAEQRKANATITEAIEKYKALGQVAPAALEKLQHELTQTAAISKQVGTSVSGMGQLFGQVKTIAAGVFAGFSAVSVVQGLTGIAQGALDAAGNLTDLAMQTGASASALSRMQNAAKPFGVEIDTITNVIAGMNDKIASGDTSAVAAFDKLGLKLHELKASGPDEAFLSIVEGLTKITDPMERTRVAFDALGPRAKEALKIIDEGFLENARHGKGWSEETIKRLDDAGDAWGDLKDNTVLFTGEAIAGLGSVVSWLGTLGSAVEDVTGKWLTLDNTGIFDKIADNRVGNFIRDSLILDGTPTAPKSPLSSGAVPTLFGGPQTLTELDKLTERLKKEAEAAQKAAEAAKALGDWHTQLLRATTPATIAINNQANALNALARAYDVVGDAFTRGAGLGLDITGARGGSGRGSLVSLAGFVNTPGQVAASTLGNQISLGGFVGAGASPTPARPGLTWNLSALPQQLIGAFTGGANIGQGLGSVGGGLAGNALGGFASGMGAFLSNGLLKVVGSALPIVGPLLGGFLGKALGGLFGPSKRELADREANAGIAQTQAGLVGQYGSVANIAGMSTAGEALAAGWGARGVAGQAQLNTLIADFNAMAERQGELRGQIADTEGKILPLEQERARLAESLVVPYSEVARIAQEYGLSLDSMGGAIAQLGTTDSFSKVINDFDTLSRAAQAAGGELDWGGVLSATSERISGLVQDAKRLGTALPENMRPYIEELIRAGKLTDENGEKITDMAGIKFGPAIETQAEKTTKAMDAISLAIGELNLALKGFTDALTATLPAAARAGAAGVESAFAGANPTLTVDIEYNDPGYTRNSQQGDNDPRMAAGGIVRWPTRAVIGEAGPEAVIPLSGHALRDLVPQASRMVGELRWRGQTIADVVWSETRTMAVARGFV